MDSFEDVIGTLYFTVTKLFGFHCVSGLCNHTFGSKQLMRN